MRILAIIGFLTHIAMLALIMGSCNQMNANRQEPKAPTPTVETSAAELTKNSNSYNKNSNSYNRYEEYSLEGCQYIVVGFGKERWGSHKGNCSSPIHDK
jgi:hypothetical protein